MGALSPLLLPLPALLSSSSSLVSCDPVDPFSDIFVSLPRLDRTEALLCPSLCSLHALSRGLLAKSASPGSAGLVVSGPPMIRTPPFGTLLDLPMPARRPNRLSKLSRLRYVNSAAIRAAARPREGCTDRSTVDGDVS